MAQKNNSDLPRTYPNVTEPVPGPYNPAMLLKQHLRVEGYIVVDCAERYP